ncbi:6-phosphofructokinase [Patescibacteria group bacterium]|nr:6-phosphofructokinase [Patescibacteria group bacterium]
MKKTKNILVLTGGGLSPSLNPTLYGVITATRRYNYKILGGVSGWASLVQNGKIINLTNFDIESIKRRGGNFLRSSRTNPFKVKNGLNNLKDKLAKYNIEGVIAIGGDDTLGAAAKLYQKEKFPVVGLPKTVDNDLPLTYFSPGFPSAAYYTAKLIAETKEDAAYTYSRVYIVELYGAKAGWLACSAALGGADIIIPPEWQFKLNDILTLVKKKYEANGNYCVIAVSREANITGIKGAPDRQPDGFSKPRKEYVCLPLQDKIQSRLGLTTKIIIPMNYVQSGNPIKLDMEIGHKLGRFGVELIKNKKYGCVAVIDYAKGKFTIKEIASNKFLIKTKNMGSNMFNQKTMQPTEIYLKYLKTLIGDYNFIDKNYQKLQQKICKK